MQVVGQLLLSGLLRKAASHLLHDGLGQAHAGSTVMFCSRMRELLQMRRGPDTATSAQQQQRQQRGGGRGQGHGSSRPGTPERWAGQHGLVGEEGAEPALEAVLQEVVQQLSQLFEGEERDTEGFLGRGRGRGRASPSSHAHGPAYVACRACLELAVVPDTLVAVAAVAAAAGPPGARVALCVPGVRQLLSSGLLLKAVTRISQWQAIDQASRRDLCRLLRHLARLCWRGPPSPTRQLQDLDLSDAAALAGLQQPLEACIRAAAAGVARMLESEDGEVLAGALQLLQELTGYSTPLPSSWQQQQQQPLCSAHLPTEALLQVVSTGGMAAWLSGPLLASCSPAVQVSLMHLGAGMAQEVGEVAGLLLQAGVGPAVIQLLKKQHPNSYPSVYGPDPSSVMHAGCSLLHILSLHRLCEPGPTSGPALTLDAAASAPHQAATAPAPQQAASYASIWAPLAHGLLLLARKVLQLPSQQSVSRTSCSPAPGPPSTSSDPAAVPLLLLLVNVFSPAAGVGQQQQQQLCEELLVQHGLPSLLLRLLDTALHKDEGGGPGQGQEQGQGQGRAIIHGHQDASTPTSVTSFEPVPASNGGDLHAPVGPLPASSPAAPSPSSAPPPSLHAGPGPA